MAFKKFYVKYDWYGSEVLHIFISEDWCFGERMKKALGYITIITFFINTCKLFHLLSELQLKVFIVG